MKYLAIVPTLLLASLALAAPTAWHVFDDTTSPNRRYAVVWGVPKIRTESHLEGAAVTDARGADVSESVKNYLYDSSKGKTIVALRGFEFYPRRNHCDLKVKWASDSSVACAEFDGKWEPIALALVTPKGKQVSILEPTMNKAKQFLDSQLGSDPAYQAAKPNLTISVASVQVFSNEIALVLNVTDGKVANYEKPLFLRHRFDVSTTGVITLGRTSVAEDPK